MPTTKDSVAGRQTPIENAVLPSLAQRCLHVVALVSLGVAQPLLDVLGRDPQYFAVHHFDPSELALLTAVLLFILPVPLLLAEILLGGLPARFAAAAHGAVIAAAVALLVLPGFEQLPGNVAIALATIAGLALALAYLRSPPLRSVFSVLGLAPLVVAGLFFARLSGAGILAGPEIGVELAKLPPAARAPIFFLIFDEFAASALVDENFDINPHRYPHLAELSRHANWFPNAVAVAQNTTRAVPAIVTGIEPQQGRLPSVRDHARSLFTLLGGSYDIWAEEPATSLCPAELNRQGRPPRSWSALSTDLLAVYLHIVLPESFRSELPAIDENWGSFTTTGTAGNNVATYVFRARDALTRDRRVPVAEFIDAIEAEDERVLYFAHFLLPHTPWEFLPSGQRYDAHGSWSWGSDGFWDQDPSVMAQAYQRYLLQLGYVDRVVGQLVQRLHELDLFEEALIVVAGDHGLSFMPGEHRRFVSEKNAHEIVLVPLIIKEPGQREGRRIDRRVRTTDILPTVVEMLGVESPWPFDGRSALSGEFRSGPIPFMVKERGVLQISPEIVERQRELVRWKLENFGNGEDPLDLFRTGPDRDLVGRRLEDLPLEAARWQAEVHGLEALENVDPSGDVLPVFLTGTVHTDLPDAPCCRLAAVLDGKIVSLTTTRDAKGSTRKFSLLLPPTSVMAGGRFGVLEIEERDGRRRLRPLTLSPAKP
jgi:hypothetical protein